MPMRTNADGTIDVRVELIVQVDPKAWAEDMMGDPAALQTDVRRDVKRWVRNHLVEDNMDGERPYGDVTVRGLYP